MEITTEHIAAFFTGAACVVGLLRVIAPRTQTVRDDDLIKAIDQGKDWVEKTAPTIWHIVEMAGASGKLPAGISKGIYFLELLRKGYSDAKGSSLPKDLEQTAFGIANSLSKVSK